MGEVAGAGLLAHVPTIMLPYAERLELNEGNFDDGLWVQQVINAVELSHHERRWVSLPLDGPAGEAAR